MPDRLSPGPAGSPGRWIDDSGHRDWLETDARRQLAFFAASINPAGGFYSLGTDGHPLKITTATELHTTTRLIHSYVLGLERGLVATDIAERIIDHGMQTLLAGHRDTKYGGYVWACDNHSGISDGRKLAYGHVFVLLAAAAALRAGHPDAQRLFDDIVAVIERHFWDEQAGLFIDEWNRDFSPFSDYRGMNANMHGVEALLAAHVASGDPLFLERADRVLDFFLFRIAPAHRFRIPEHYDASWQVDREHEGDPMFRPYGTTPGHSFEWARLLLEYRALARLDATRGDAALQIAESLAHRAMDDGWDLERGGGIYYTLDFDGTVRIADRYWWPLSEAIGLLATLQRIAPSEQYEAWYRRAWQFASDHYIDHQRGGWYPEINDSNEPASTQFVGKPDIYHALQADVISAG